MSREAEKFIACLCAELHSLEPKKLADPRAPDKICGWRIGEKTVIVSTWADSQESSVCVTYLRDTPMRHSTRRYSLTAGVANLSRRIKQFLDPEKALEQPQPTH